MRNRKECTIKRAGGCPSQDTYNANMARMRGGWNRRKEHEKELEILKTTSLKDLIH
jgi:hypothetical protein